MIVNRYLFPMRLNNIKCLVCESFIDDEETLDPMDLSLKNEYFACESFIDDGETLDPMDE
jgi:hypothetical protein